MQMAKVLYEYTRSVNDLLTLQVEMEQQAFSCFYPEA